MQPMLSRYLAMSLWTAETTDSVYCVLVMACFPKDEKCYLTLLILHVSWKLSSANKAIHNHIVISTCQCSFVYIFLCSCIQHYTIFSSRSAANDIDTQKNESGACQHSCHHETYDKLLAVNLT